MGLLIKHPRKSREEELKDGEALFVRVLFYPQYNFFVACFLVFFFGLEWPLFDTLFELFVAFCGNFRSEGKFSYTNNCAYIFPFMLAWQLFFILIELFAYCLSGPLKSLKFRFTSFSLWRVDILILLLFLWVATYMQDDWINICENSMNNQIKISIKDLFWLLVDGFVSVFPLRLISSYIGKPYHV